MHFLVHLNYLKLLLIFFVMGILSTIGFCIGIGVIAFILVTIFSNLFLPIPKFLYPIVIICAVFLAIFESLDKTDYAKLKTGVDGMYSFYVQTEVKERLWLEMNEDGTVTAQKEGWFGKKDKTEYSYGDIYFLGEVVQNASTSRIDGIQLSVTNKESGKKETWRFITGSAAKLYQKTLNLNHEHPGSSYVNTKAGKQNLKSLVSGNLSWWENSTFTLFVVSREE